MRDDRIDEWSLWEGASARDDQTTKTNDNATDPVARRNERSEAPAKHRNEVPIEPPKARKNFRKIGDLSRFYE